MKVIDWEMASCQLLGFDLFTFIFKSRFELTPKAKCSELLAENKHWIDRFFLPFGIENWHPYLLKFALLMQHDRKNDKKLNTHFDNLVKYLTQQ